MFGTIGHATLKPGNRSKIEELMVDWKTTIRPRIPGAFVNYAGNLTGQPDHLVFIALAQDEATYRNLANLPEQDAWFHRFMELVEGEVRWEDVEMETVL